MSGIPEDVLDRRQLNLIYYPSGKMAHLIDWPNMPTSIGRRITEGDAPLCDRVPWWHTPLGTGNQDEWDRARALPLCAEYRRRARL